MDYILVLNSQRVLSLKGTLNESFEKVASYGLLPNMIFYMLNDYHLEVANATTILFLWSALFSRLALLGVFLFDSYLGRFRGMALLWLTTMNPQLKPPSCIPLSRSYHSTTLAQLISIRAGYCIRPCSMALGANQLDNKKDPNNERLQQSFINWYYASIGVSTILALTFIINIQDQYGDSNALVTCHVLVGFFTGFFQVPVAAFRNRSLALPDQDSAYNHSHNSFLTAPTMKLRYLNKACIIRDPQQDLNPHDYASNPWKLCTVDQVEFLKAVLRVIPICSCGIMILLSMFQQSFSIIQANSMDRRLFPNIQIPAGSFTVFTIITMTVYMVIYDRVLAPILHQTAHGVGLLLSIVGTVLCAIVESIRRRTAINEGLAHKPDAVTSISAMWLIPQYSLFRLAEAMNAFPKSMYSMGMALHTLSTALSSLVGAVLVGIVDGVTGKGGNVSWLSSNINKGHLDYY
ncbi:hypothetical protein PVL29_014194 [Vitis rotundifolia]|uniref:Protein NRT1/ PTR FAMILY 1.2-like n=1 Tax=Vitis rotundifolia TaxID=103349 RepID=A0AA38ZGG8_VITRO|nr:hypothetical protein PVL29_014194 [Vitis rotundifolia]